MTMKFKAVVVFESYQERSILTLKSLSDMDGLWEVEEDDDYYNEKFLRKLTPLDRLL